MNPVEDMNLKTKNRYYVYCHVDPKTGELVYFGKGTYGRAWDVTRARKQNTGHCEWMKNLSDEGYLPTDWVKIMDSGLSEKQAYAKEKEYLNSYEPTRFNGQAGERNYQAKLTNKQAIEVYKRIHAGERAIVLADEFQVSTAAIYHIKKGTQWRSVTSSIRN